MKEILETLKRRAGKPMLTQELADLLGVTIRTVGYYRERGEIANVVDPLDRRRKLYKVAEVRRFVRARFYASGLA